jgi:hypothetical protein
MRLIFIQGPAASGKRTIARELAAQTGLPLFHNHLIVDALLAVFPFGSPQFITLREKMWFDVFKVAGETGRSLIFTFHPEASVAADFPQRVIALVEAAGGKVEFVAITCPADVIAQRVDAPSRQASGKLSSRALLTELEEAGAFAYPHLPAAVTIDSSALTPSAAAGTIRAALRLDRR